MFLVELGFPEGCGPIPTEPGGQATDGLGSLLGRFSVGNTGRARAPINQPMPIPPDLEAILADVSA